MRNCNVKSILVKDFLEISGVKVALLLGGVAKPPKHMAAPPPATLLYIHLTR